MISFVFGNIGTNFAYISSCCFYLVLNDVSNIFNNFQGAFLQIWIRTIWNTEQRAAEHRLSCRVLWIQLHPTKTLDVRKWFCWSATEPALAIKDGGKSSNRKQSNTLIIVFLSWRSIQFTEKPPHSKVSKIEAVLSVCCRFGLPFVLYLERSVTWDVLQKEILEKMRHLLRPGVYIQVSDTSSCCASTGVYLLYSYLFVAINVSLVGSVQINLTFSLQLALIKWIDYFRLDLSVCVWSEWLESHICCHKRSSHYVTPLWKGLLCMTTGLRACCVVLNSRCPADWFERRTFVSPLVHIHRRANTQHFYYSGINYTTLQRHYISLDVLMSIDEILIITALVCRQGDH